MRHMLRLHPDSRCGAVARLEVDMSRPGPRRLELAYTVAGRIDALALPPVSAPERSDALWRHTCFEAFVGGPPGAGYYEFNFSPSTQWAVYRFDGYRSGMRVASEIGRPQITVQTAPERYMLQASLELDRLPEHSNGGAGDGAPAPWRVGLAAVIEDAAGRLSYWALAHPAGKPDFHHSDGFALELA